MSRAVAMLEEAVRPGSAFVNDLRKGSFRIAPLMRVEVQPVLDQMGAHVRGLVEHHGGLLIEAKQEPSAAEQERIAAILAAAGLSRFGTERIKPLLERQWRRSALMTLQVLQQHDFLTTDANRIARKILEMGGRRIGLMDLTGEAKQALFTIMNLGRELGLGAESIAKLTEQIVPQGRFVNAGPRYRAEMIARTETLTAQRMTTIEAFRSSPAVHELEAFDGESDEECAARNGELYSFDQAEIETMTTHPNCVLAFAPVT